MRGRTGRPATLYRLTDAGDHLFPKQYDVLAIAMIDAIAEELGGDAVLRLLAKVSNAKVDALTPLLEGRSLEKRLAVLKSWYAEDDPHMDVEMVDGDIRLIERNCPFYNIAMRRPALCSVSVHALTRLLGVHVERDEKFQNGDGRCVFHAYANQPIDSATYEFRLES